MFFLSQQEFTFAKQFYEAPVVITTARHPKGNTDPDNNAINEWVHVRKIIENVPELLCFLLLYGHLSFYYSVFLASIAQQPGYLSEGHSTL